MSETSHVSRFGDANSPMAASMVPSHDMLWRNLGPAWGNNTVKSDEIDNEIEQIGDRYFGRIRAFGTDVRHRMKSAKSTRDADLRADSSSMGSAIDFSKRPRKINALTSLRFVAAALIVMHHTRGHFGFSESFWAPFALGHGVTFFFVLSGFILTYVYPSLEGVGRRRFLLARFARIWPAHVATFLLLCILLPDSADITHDRYSLFSALANLSMVQSWIPLSRINVAFNGPAWSISTEFGFYVFFLLLIANWRRTWHVKLAVTIFLVCLMIFIGNLLHAPETSLAKWTVSLEGLVYTNPLARVFEFALGMTTALAVQRFDSRIKFGRLVATVIELFALALVAITMYSTSLWDSLLSRSWIGPAGRSWLALGGYSCLACAFLVFIMALERGFIARLLSFPLFVLLGEISYSVYLVHQMLITWYEGHLRPFQWLPPWFIYSGFWITTLLAAYVIWVAIERPCRTFLVGLWPRTTVAASGSRAGFEKKRGSITTPTWRWAMPQVAALLVILIFIVYSIHVHPNFSLTNNAYAEVVAAHGTQQVRDANFGDKFMLRGADVLPARNGMTLELVWQSVAAQPLDYNVFVHYLDRSGNIVGQADYPIDTAHTTVRAGTLWRDLISMPTERLKGATRIGVGIYQPKMPPLMLDAGHGDQENRRVLIPLISPVSTNAPSTSAPVPSIRFSIDTVNGMNVVQPHQEPVQITAGSEIKVQGWVMDAAADAPVASVSIVIDGKIEMIADYGLPRPDLVAGYGPKYASAGYTVSIPAGKLADGRHILTLKAVASDRTTTFALPTQVEVVIANRQKIAATQAIAPGTGLSNTIEGFQEATTCDLVEGWVWDSANPSTVLAVDIFDGRTLIATVTANRFRADLLAGRKGDGNHAFSYTLPPSLLDGKVHEISAKVSGIGIELRDSSKIIKCS